jgi:hypothetical protein
MTKTDILDPNPFANSVLASQGDSAARDIYTDVGFAMDRWEHCETSFGVLYSALVKPEGGNHILMRSFGMITASRTRQQMIQAACDAYFATYKNDDLKKKVRHLLNLYGDAAARRNEIAHALVMGEARHKVVDKVAVPLPTVWFLVPPLFATRKTEMHMQGPKYRYSTRELSHFTKCFEELSARVMALTQSIRAFYASLPEKFG